MAQFRGPDVRWSAKMANFEVHAALGVVMCHISEVHPLGEAPKWCTFEVRPAIEVAKWGISEVHALVGP